VEKTLAALRAIPSIQSATISGDIPLIAAAASNMLYTRPDGEILPVDKRAAAAYHQIAPDYLKTFGIPLVAGREFDQHDIAGNQNVMLISQAGARKVFGNENPIGKTLLISFSSMPVEIVGVVGDVRTRSVANPDEVELYRPWAQENIQFAVIAVRSPLREDAVTKVVQSALNTVDPGLAIAIPQSMDAIVAQALGQARLMTWLLGIFSGAALLLATVGIYGAVAYTVEQRTGEIGIRMALGAQTTDVLRLIVNQGMRPVIFGLVVGLAAAVALGRLIASQLYQTSAHNPLLLAATMSILGLAALLACVFPARRAAMVDPVQALRTE
jgi:putative ABC transport system permease protein